MYPNLQTISTPWDAPHGTDTLVVGWCWWKDSTRDVDQAFCRVYSYGNNGNSDDFCPVIKYAKSLVPKDWDVQVQVGQTYESDFFGDIGK